MSHLSFPITRWSLVPSAKDAGEKEASKRALEELALAYWMPIYAYLRQKGYAHQEGQDLTQTFFAQLLRRDFLKNLQPEGGKFRNFLLVSLRHMLIDDHARVSSRQQRAEIALEPWHESQVTIDYPGAESPEEAFDRTWARALVARVMVTLAERWQKRAGLFAELRYTIESPGNVAKHAEIADRLGMTVGAVDKAAFDFRRQFNLQVRKEIRDTVASDDEVEEELRYLVRLFC